MLLLIRANVVESGDDQMKRLARDTIGVMGILGVESCDASLLRRKALCFLTIKVEF